MIEALTRPLLTALAGALAWAAVVLVGFSEGWARPPLTGSKAPSEFLAAARSYAEQAGFGNLALVLIEDGTVAAAHYASAGRPVGPDSLFQVASLSKWLSAVGVMALVEDGALELDAPVSNYLTRWALPPGPHDADGVTVRRLLSHTAGLDDGLGYAGFAAATDVQTLEASLTRAQDASPGARGAVRVAAEPGSGWAYSGGGYTLLQLLVEEVSGQTFNDFMKARVFLPAGMRATTFDHGEARATGLADNFDASGGSEPFRHYTSLAATSAYTSARDLVEFVRSQTPGQPEGSGRPLSLATLQEMRQPHAARLGEDIWGLGVMLYAPNGAGDFIIGHDGSNEPAINTAARLDPDTGDGIVVLETGGSLLATRLAGEWGFWKTGNVDTLMFSMGLGGALRLAAAGAGAMLLLGGVWAWLRWRRR